MRIFKSYDALGRTTQTIHKLDGTSYVTLTSYGYPQNPSTTPGLGRAVSSQSLPDFERVAYTYDAGGAQQSIKTTPPQGGSQQTIISSVQRNALGQTTQVVYGNNAVSTHSYDPATLRLSGIKTVGATTLQDYLYSFDYNGNVTGVTDNLSSTLSATYRYDKLDQLTSMTPAGQSLLPYRYDNLGNLTNKENATQTYGGAGRGPHALANAQGLTYNYDANGNLTETRNSSNSVITGITWNAENMPIQVVQGGVTQYQKFFLGESLWKKVEAGVTTYYLPSMRVENGQFRKFFGGFAERSPDGSLKFYHNDHLGSASLVTNASGNLISRQAYMPFGEDRFIDPSGSFTPKYQFNFKEKESTGFYDYGARLYNPATGRWLSADSSARDGLNRYSYVGNNPLRYTDPTGHFLIPPQAVIDWAKEKAKEKAREFVKDHFTAKGFVKEQVKDKLVEALTGFLLKATGQGEQVEGENLNLGIIKLPVGLVHTGDTGDEIPVRVAAVMTVEAFANRPSLGFRDEATVVVVDAAKAWAANAKDLVALVGTHQHIGMGKGPLMVVEFTPATVNMEFARDPSTGQISPRFTRGGLQEFRVPNANILNLTDVRLRLVNDTGNYALTP